MPIHTEPEDRKYVRIVDTYHDGESVSYGIVIAKTIPTVGIIPTEEHDFSRDRPYYIIEMPDGKQQIHPCYACTEITEKEYFYAVLGGNV